MAKVDHLRVPPALGPDMPRPGSLLVSDFDAKAVPILDTYSPYPVLNSSARSRDPFGLNVFLLAPYDDVWQYMNPSVVPTEDLPLDEQPKLPSPTDSEPRESRRLSNIRRSSPLASNPPVSAELGGKPESLDGPDDQDDVASAAREPEMADVAGASGNTFNSKKSQPTGSRFRMSLMGRKSALIDPSQLDAAADDVPVSSRSRLSDSRTDSVCSGLSSVSSSDGSFEGIQTPADGATVPVDVSPATVAAALDNGNKKPGWRDWLSTRRPTSFLGLKNENGTSLLESPRASVIDLAPHIPEPEPEVDVIESRVANTDAARTARQLRRISIAKLAALRMPSPHPLSLVLTRQHVNLPNEVAYSIPATKRVFPMSVNVVQRGVAHELQPAQGGGLRLALAVRGVISKIDKGERPYGIALHAKKYPQPNNIPRPRGVRDFIDRPPFEERMVTYYPGDVCTHVSMARSGFAIYDLEYSDYIIAMAETEENPPAWSGSPKPPLASSSTGSLLPPPRRASPPVADKRASVAIDKRASRVMDPKRQSILDIKGDSRPGITQTTSFRTARPKPSTWDDSDEEEDEIATDSDDNNVKRPVRPVATRTRTAPSANRASRMVDPAAAMDMLNRARERRAQFNKGECERKAESDNRRSVIMLSSNKQATKSTSTLVKPADPTQLRKLQHRTSTATLSKLPDRPPQPPQPSKRASSGTLHAKAMAQREAAPTPSRARQPQRPPSSLPSSPRSGPQQDRRRVVSQYDPMAAMNAQHRQSMGMGLYGVPPVPPVPVYPSPMMAQPMMYAPVAMPPIMGYNQQYAMGMPQMPQMYRPPPPQMQIANPAMLPTRRRERPVS